MKQILIYFSLFFLSSCNLQFNQPQKTSECPQKTTAILIAENLENVNLTTETITKSSICCKLLPPKVLKPLR